MLNILYLDVLILIIGWAAGYFAFNIGAFIHVLLVIALIIVVTRLIKDRKSL